MKYITICVPTVEARRSLLSRLLWTLSSQLEYAEVIVADGEWPMGDKLNAMFATASTPYVVAVDDDDLVDPNFVVAGVIGGRYDFLGYRILYTEDGHFAGSVAHRGDGDTTWSTFDRGVSPKCMVRTEIARSVVFGNHYTADREWSEQVQEQVLSHTFIDEHLYHYDHWNRHMLGTTPAAGKLSTPQRDVGTWPYDPKGITWL